MDRSFGLKLVIGLSDENERQVKSWKSGQIERDRGFVHRINSNEEIGIVYSSNQFRWVECRARYEESFIGSIQMSVREVGKDKEGVEGRARYSQDNSWGEDNTHIGQRNLKKLINRVVGIAYSSNQFRWVGRMDPNERLELATHRTNSKSDV